MDLDGDMTGKGLGGKDVCPRGEEPAVLGDGCGEGAIWCKFVRDRGDEPAVLGVGIICLEESLYRELVRGEVACHGESGVEMDLTGDGGITRGGSGCG